MNRPVQPRERLIRIALGILVLLIGLAGSVGAASVTVRNYTAKIAAFQVYAFNKALTDSTFTTCNAIDGWSYGFLNAGEGSPNSVSDITYSGCSAINCGRASQYNPWTPGLISPNQPIYPICLPRTAGLRGHGSRDSTLR